MPDQAAGLYLREAGLLAAMREVVADEPRPLLFATLSSRLPAGHEALALVGETWCGRGRPAGCALRFRSGFPSACR
ncbi:MAG TPA: hypothetical protein VGX23_28775 [Actinocrinis sp.]|nr:hypothetical protein [Actinocrinis sp.]